LILGINLSSSEKTNEPDESEEGADVGDDDAQSPPIMVHFVHLTHDLFEEDYENVFMN